MIVATFISFGSIGQDCLYFLCFHHRTNSSLYIAHHVPLGFGLLSFAICAQCCGERMWLECHSTCKPQYEYWALQLGNTTINWIGTPEDNVNEESQVEKQMK